VPPHVTASPAGGKDMPANDPRTPPPPPLFQLHPFPLRAAARDRLIKPKPAEKPLFFRAIPSIPGKNAVNVHGMNASPPE